MNNANHLTALPDYRTDSNDNVALLGGRKSPAITVTTAIEPSSTYRGVHSRQHSAVDETTAEDFRPGTRERFLGSCEPPTPKVRKQSPGPSTASSIIRRMTTLRTPLSRFRSIAKPSSGQYSSLEGETDSDQVPVDITTLEGLGYELRDISPSTSDRLENEETEYQRPSDLRRQQYKIKRRTVGGGMVNVGAQLRRNPSSSNPNDVISEEVNADGSLVDRKKSVRDIGQSLAKEKNVIVVVNEAIDLSSYEGHQPLNHRASTTFDSMLSSSSRHSVHPQETKSYFFPDDPDIPNWKPVSMRPTYILFLTLIALALAIIQEILCQKSLRRAEHRSGLLAFDKVADLSLRAFFSWKYLPTMVAIVYAVLFSIMDFDIRRLEPYYQLSQPNGARAAASLNLDHLTMFQYFIPFKAFRLKQWAVFFSTTGNIIASMVGPALQNPSLVFVTNDNPKCDTDGCPGDERIFWVRVSPVWSRLLSASYFVIALITVILFLQLRRKSGLLSDPKGIAGIASMATKSHILHEFAGLDEATRGQIHRKLQHRRFVLYKSSIWQGEWSASSEQVQESERRLRSPHPLLLRKEGAFPLIGFMILCLLGVPLISLTRARVIPNTVPWLPVLLATLLKLLFTTFEADVRMMEPFYQLSLGNATPQNSLTLDYQAPPYIWVVFKAVLNKHWLVALVGLASVALDVLTVTVSSFSIKSEMFLSKEHGDTSSEDETKVSFYVSLALSITILTSVIIITSLVYARRRHPFLPREPSTIAAVLAFIYASNMLTDFIDTERLSNAEMEKRLKGLGKRYGLGWFRGRYGKVNCAIDEEPMITNYVHGKSYTMAQAAPLQPADTFYSV